MTISQLSSRGGRRYRSFPIAFPFPLPALTLVLTLAVLPGCDSTIFSSGRGRGGGVSFRVSTGYDNAPSSSSVVVGADGAAPDTKTSYSGHIFTVGSSRRERIDWEDGDLFSVYCAAAEGSLKKSDYRVLSHSASGHTSTAAIAPATGNGINWGTGEHVFYAMYPSSGSSGDPSKVSLNGNTLTGTIPPVQTVTRKAGTHTYLPDMRYAYMYAATTVPSSGVGSSVGLWFKPMVTALEFTVDSYDASSLSLYSFELISSAVALTGDFTATVTAATGENAMCTYALPSHNASNSKITVDFGGVSNPTVITKGSPITFTVFALPQSLSGLKAKFVTSSGIRTIALSYSGSGGASVNFFACRKSRITNIRVPQLPQLPRYIDQVGRDFGFGIPLDGIIWAPVNCGTDTIAPNPSDHRMGLLYQWGRAYGHGHGYADIDGIVVESNLPTIVFGPTDTPVASNFYRMSFNAPDWKTTPDDNLWNSGTEASPVKTANDPCPNGWRVPTISEYERLGSSPGITSSWVGEGRRFTDGTNTLYFPATGYRMHDGRGVFRGSGSGGVGYYWSSSVSGPKAMSWDFTQVGYTIRDITRVNGHAIRCVAE